MWPMRCCPAPDGCGSRGAAAGARPADTPPLTVTEHRAHVVRCPRCRARTRVAFPTAAADQLRDQALARPVACMEGDRPAGSEGHGLAAHALRRDPHLLPSAEPRQSLKRACRRGRPFRCLREPVSAGDRAHPLNAHFLRNLQEMLELVPEGWAACLQQMLLGACNTNGAPEPSWAAPTASGTSSILTTAGQPWTAPCASPPHGPCAHPQAPLLAQDGNPGNPQPCPTGAHHGPMKTLSTPCHFPKGPGQPKFGDQSLPLPKDSLARKLHIALTGLHQHNFADDSKTSSYNS